MILHYEKMEVIVWLLVVAVVGDLRELIRMDTLSFFGGLV